MANISILINLTGLFIQPFQFFLSHRIYKHYKIRLASCDHFIEWIRSIGDKESQSKLSCEIRRSQKLGTTTRIIMLRGISPRLAFHKTPILNRYTLQLELHELFVV